MVLSIHRNGKEMTTKKNRLILILGLLLLSGFIVTSLSSYLVSRSSIQQQISEDELPITSDNIYSEIQRDLLRPIFISSLMASDTFLRDWAINGEQDSTKIIRYLKEIQDKYNTFTSFFVSEKTRIYYQSEGILKTVSPDSLRDEWYFRVRDMKPDYEINVDPDMANKDAMTIFINYRVFDYNGNYIGATGVGLTVNAVKEIIKNYQKKYDRNIYFIDRSGSVILHSTLEPMESLSINVIPGLSSIADSILASQGNALKYRHNGNTIHVNTRYISEFDWILIVEKTDAQATRNIMKTFLINLLICFIITGIVLVLTNITVTSFQKRLEKMAVTDKLTGLYNRQAFDVILTQAVKEAKRRMSSFSIVMFDIDYFKKVNDSHGHLHGDAVLVDISDICRENTRESDAVCRWGGEEIIMLLKDCSLDDAEKTAEKIRKAIETSRTVYSGSAVAVTVSAGITSYRMTDTEESILARADKALYKAKQNGRNRTESSGT